MKIQTSDKHFEVTVIIYLYHSLVNILSVCNKPVDLFRKCSNPPCVLFCSVYCGSGCCVSGTVGGAAAGWGSGGGASATGGSSGWLTAKIYESN